MFNNQKVLRELEFQLGHGRISLNAHLGCFVPYSVVDHVADQFKKIYMRLKVTRAQGSHSNSAIDRQADPKQVITLWYFSQLSCKIGHKGQVLSKPYVVLQLCSLNSTFLKFSCQVSIFFQSIERQHPHAEAYPPNQTYIG